MCIYISVPIFPIDGSFFKILYLSSGITSFKCRLSELRETKNSLSKRFFIFNFLKFSCSRKVPSIILKDLSEIGVKTLLKMRVSRKFWSFLKWMFLRHSTDYTWFLRVLRGDVLQ